MIHYTPGGSDDQPLAVRLAPAPVPVASTDATSTGRAFLGNLIAAVELPRDPPIYMAQAQVGELVEAILLDRSD